MKIGCKHGDKLRSIEASPGVYVREDVYRDEFVNGWHSCTPVKIPFNIVGVKHVSTGFFRRGLSKYREILGNFLDFNLAVLEQIGDDICWCLGFRD